MLNQLFVFELFIDAESSYLILRVTTLSPGNSVVNSCSEAVRIPKGFSPTLSGLLSPMKGEKCASP